MTIPTEVIMKMATIGLSKEQAEAVADMLTAVETATKNDAEAVVAVSREKGRERWRKWKEKQPTNVSKRLQTSANVSQRLTRVEDKPLTTDIPTSKKQTHSADVEAFKAAFAGVCDGDRVEAIIKHRRTKRGQITGHAASLFLADARAAGLTPAQAIDTCISRNWITVKADWLAPRQQSTAPPGKPRSVLDAVRNLNTRMEQADAISTEAIEGTGATVLRLSAAHQQR